MAIFLTTLLTVLLPCAPEQALGDPRGERDPGPFCGSLKRVHMDLRNPHAELLLLAGVGGLPALDAVRRGHEDERITTAYGRQVRDRPGGVRLMCHVRAHDDERSEPNVSGQDNGCPRGARAPARPCRTDPGGSAAAGRCPDRALPLACAVTSMVRRVAR